MESYTRYSLASGLFRSILYCGTESCVVFNNLFNVVYSSILWIYHFFFNPLVLLIKLLLQPQTYPSILSFVMRVLWGEMLTFLTCQRIPILSCQLGGARGWDGKAGEPRRDLLLPVCGLFLAPLAPEFIAAVTSSLKFRGALKPASLSPLRSTVSARPESLRHPCPSSLV